MPSKRSAPDNAFYDLLMAARQLMRRLRDEWYGGDLSWSQISAMARLEREGSQTTADLARAEGVTPQSMGTAMASLEQAGLVVREHHPTDGRQMLFALTDNGRRARTQGVASKRAWVAEAMKGLTPAERQTLVDAAALLRRLEHS